MLVWWVYGIGFVVGGAILLTHLALGVGTIRNRVRDRALSRAWVDGTPILPAPLPRVTVVVVAKDEAAVLPTLLESLEGQTFSDFDVVLVDDRSADCTGEIMASFGRKSSHQVTVLRNDNEPDGVTGKVQALDVAVAASRGEILLFTDSDCTLPPTWVGGHLACYAEPDVGAVFGPIGMAPASRFLDVYQAFDQRLIHQYSSGSAGLGLPTGCFGNNLSVRREAVDAVGGFAGLGYTITEDAAMVAAIGRQRRWRVLSSTLSQIAITTRPQPTWSDFVNQHTRWNIGGYYAEDRATRLGYRFLVLYLAGSILALPFALLAPLLPILALDSFVSIGTLAVLDATLYPGRTARDRLVVLPCTVFFLLFYGYVTARAVLRRRPEWKGARLEIGG